MTSSNKVHVAVYIFKGVLEGLEVFTGAEAAERQAVVTVSSSTVEKEVK